MPMSIASFSTVDCGIHFPDRNQRARDDRPCGFGNRSRDDPLTLQGQDGSGQEQLGSKQGCADSALHG